MASKIFCRVDDEISMIQQGKKKRSGKKKKVTRFETSVVKLSLIGRAASPEWKTRFG